MDFKIWEKPVIAWVNTISTLTPTKSLNENVLTDIIKKLKPDFQNGVVEFLKEIFPKLFQDDLFKLYSSDDYICAATLLLIYISFSKRSDLEELREIMCTKLDNPTQVNIAEFLMNIQEHENVFNLSFKAIKQEIYNFIERNSSQTTVIGDNVKTPVKSNISNNSFGSPLQGFFLTPKRSQSNRRTNSFMCGDGDHVKIIKKLTNQLVEEELEKASLQEQLNSNTQKCNEYEVKLRNKIDEINLLKTEWENESKKNEVEFKSLKNNLIRKIEDEKKIKNELSQLENYVNILGNDLSSSKSEKDKLEFQLKGALDKCLKFESQLEEASEINYQLQKTIESKEQELVQLKEEFTKQHKHEESFDISYMNGSFNKSLGAPESMGVVIDKLLIEKNEENALLKETIEELQKEKRNLFNEIQQINEQLSLKCSTISELEFLNKELSAKVENFDITEKELIKIRKELNNANTEINQLMKENSHLTEKSNALNFSLKEQEQALINCKNSKMLLHMNFLKLAEDFKIVQKRLESEIKNISRLTLDTKENFFKLEKRLASPEVIEGNSEQLNSKDVFSAKNLVSCQEVSSDFENIKLSSQIFTDDKLEKITELLQHFENHQLEWSESKLSMQKTCSQLNDNLVILKMEINDLEICHKKSLKEKIELQKHLLKAEKKVSEIQSLHDFEVKQLQAELDIRENKIKELQDLIIEYKKAKDSLVLENELFEKRTTVTTQKNFRVAQEGGDFIQNNTFINERFSETKEIEKNQELQDLSDSLEEVPVCNKTFDIVNLEEKNIIDKTFYVKKENESFICKKTNKGNSVWVVSPPSKGPPRTVAKQPSKRKTERSSQGETWIVPITPAPHKEKTKKISSSVNDLTMRSAPVKVESSSNLTKSTSLSSILEIDFSPPSKIESKSSTGSSFISLTDSKTFLRREESNDFHDIQAKKASEMKVQKTKSLEHASAENFTLTQRNEDPLGEVFNRNSIQDKINEKLVLEKKIVGLQKEITDLSNECQHLRSMLLDSENKRKKDKEIFEKNQEIIRQNIASKYESQLEHLKNEMKQLHNRELAKHKAEQSKLNSELREQNKRYKEHIDELRNQLWDLGEKLLNEQKLKRDLQRNYMELQKKLENFLPVKDSDTGSWHSSEIFNPKESISDGNYRISGFRTVPNTAFPTMPTEDEDEVFDNRFLEDMKTGHFKVEKPEGRLMELQYRNSLCLPHLKSSYPGETQFHNPAMYKENDLKLGLLHFGQESQSLTDSDHSMTRSLIPENKGKKKEQTSYKKPGPPTPSKNGGRLSLQSGDLRMTPRNVLKEINDQSERNKGTPNPLRNLLTKSVKTGSLGTKDEVSRWNKYFLIFFLLFALFGSAAYLFLNQLVLILLL